MRFLRAIPVALGLAAALALAGPASAQVLYGQATPNFKNLVDNGNFNVYQRTTTAVTGITTTATYHADRWAGYSGTSTNESLTNVTTGLPPSAGANPVFTNAEQVQRASGQTGVKPVCIIQEIPTADITPLAGQQVVLSFWATAGSNFSAASNVLNAQVATGTGTDQGLSSFISGWTGAATPINYNATLTTNWQRFATTATLASTATEAAVNICFTPVGTAGTNDYFQITGVQLETGSVATNFESIPAGLELTKLQRYDYYIAEPAASLMVGMGNYDAATTCLISIPTAQTMRVAPTVTFGTLSASTWAVITASATPVVLASTYLVQSPLGANTTNMVTLGATTASKTAGNGCQLVGAGGGSYINMSADF